MKQTKSVYTMEQKRHEKILPVKYPRITSWPSPANLFSILETSGKTQDWIYSNYIQLGISILSTREHAFDFSVQIVPHEIDLFFCPWIMPQIFSRKHISQYYSSVQDLIIEAIDSNSYVFMSINMQYAIKAITGREIGRFPHAVFIYGYSKDRNKFNVADFTFTDSGAYSYQEVDADLICRGYLDISVNEEYIAYGRKGVYLLNFVEDTNYKFDPQLVKWSFSDYCSGTGQNYHIGRAITRNNPIFTGRDEAGVDSYKLVYEYLSLIANGQQRATARTPHILYDHKNLMVYRIEFMIQNEYIEPDQDILNGVVEIRDKAIQCRNLWLKCMVSGSTGQIAKIVDGYKYIEEKERKLYPQIIQKIRV